MVGWGPWAREAEKKRPPLWTPELEEKHSLPALQVTPRPNRWYISRPHHRAVGATIKFKCSSIFPTSTRIFQAFYAFLRNDKMQLFGS